MRTVRAFAVEEGGAAATYVAFTGTWTATVEVGSGADVAPAVLTATLSPEGAFTGMKTLGGVV